MNANAPKILYFTESTVPTPEEILEIESVGVPVQVRNSEHVEGLEPCDGVLGHVPDCYPDDFPDGKKVVEKQKAERKAELDRLRKDIANEKKPKKAEEKDPPNGKTFTPGQGEK